MRDEVLKKLRAELSSSINSERQVVYIMSLIRKLFEHHKIKSYRLIGLYCDWALHTRLDRRGAREVLNSFSGPRQHSNQLKVFTFEGLRKSMERFFDRFDLPKKVVCENWFQFRKNLLYTIVDVPLYNPKASIKKFVFTNSNIPGFIGRYFISYEIILKNGSVDGGSILLADQDEETKQEMKEVELQFNRRYRLKLYGKLMKHAGHFSGAKRTEIEKNARKLAEEL